MPDYVSDTEEAIKAFIERHRISGEPYEVENRSAVYPATGNRKYHSRLTRRGSDEHAFVDGFQNVHVKEALSLPSLLWLAIDDAERYGGHETFERWLQEEDSSTLRDFGRRGAEQSYGHYKRQYNALIKVLGEDLYEELRKIVRGSRG